MDKMPVEDFNKAEWETSLKAEEVKKMVTELLKELYPNGHPDYIPTTLEELDLHSKKNYDYSHGGDPLGNFVRVANILSNYPNLDLTKPYIIAIVYALKQIDATLWMLNNKYSGTVEGIQKRVEDIYVYFKLFRILYERNEE